MSQYLNIVLMVLLCGLATPVNAQTLRYDFTGQVDVTFVDDDSDVVFGVGVPVGSPVTGFFEYDLGATQSLLESTPAASQAMFEVNPTLLISVQIGASQFESESPLLATVIDGFPVSPGSPSVDDIFQVTNGPPLFNGMVVGGNSLLVDGESELGFLGLIFVDFSSSTFDSPIIPASISLADFDAASGSIVGTNSEGVFNATSFSIGTIELASVPEPSSLFVFLKRRGGEVAELCIRLR